MSQIIHGFLFGFGFTFGVLCAVVVVLGLGGMFITKMR
jgi:hypothetical protein